MSLETSIDDLSHYTSNIIAPDIRSISNRITDLYTNDITFQQDVTVNNDLTVSGNLTVDGTTTSINTDSYTTETLEIVNTASIANSTLLKINQTKNSGNIIEVLNDTGTVITVDNSGDMTTTGTINGATPTEMSQLARIGSTTIISQLNDKQETLSSSTDVTVKNLTVDSNLEIDYKNGANGIQFYYTSDWAIYMANTSGKSFGGGTPCSGYLF